MKTICGHCNERVYVENHSLKECEMLQELKKKMDSALSDIQTLFEREIKTLKDMYEGWSLAFQVHERRVIQLEIKVNVLENNAIFKLNLPPIKDLNDIVSKELKGATADNVTSFPPNNINAQYWFNRYEVETSELECRISHLTEALDIMTHERNLWETKYNQQCERTGILGRALEETRQRINQPTGWVCKRSEINNCS